MRMMKLNKQKPVYVCRVLSVKRGQQRCQNIENKENKLELSSAKLRNLMKLSCEKVDEMIFDSLEAILKDS